MKTEMDALRMDEHQKLCWLLANRATCMLVGAVWVGMIVYELLCGRTPWFLMTMVPVFAIIRFFLFLHYSRKGARP